MPKRMNFPERRAKRRAEAEARAKQVKYERTRAARRGKKQEASK